MSTLELKNKLIKIINTSDEHFLQLVNALYNSYSKENKNDFFDELPFEIQQLLQESRIQIKQGNSKNHEDVLNDFREKYNFSK